MSEYLNEEEIDDSEQAYDTYAEVQHALRVLTEKGNIFILNQEQISDLFDVVNHAMKYTED